MKHFLLCIIALLAITITEAQVVSQKIGSSANFFGYGNLGQKQIYIRNDLNTVSFVFRNNPIVSGAGNHGHIRYNISQDRGLTWAVPNSGAGIGNINPTQPKLARFPNCFLFSNGIGVNNLHLGVLASTLNSVGTNWEGHVQLSVAPNIFNNISMPNIEQEDYTLYQGTIFPQHITERVPGEFWATMYGDTTLNDTIYVLKGFYNPNTQGVQWFYNDKLIPNWNTAINGQSHWFIPKIEFSPNGNVGYVSVLGDIVGGQDSAFMPVLWEYNPITSTFSGGYEVDITQCPQLNQIIGRPACAFNYDLSVDYEGNPHLMCLVGSVEYNYSVSKTLPIQVMDISKDANNNWSLMKIDNQWAFSEHSMHLARSEDGKYIFYTWSDTDTTGTNSNANDKPNLKGRFYDVVNDLLSPVINWTVNDPTWNKYAFNPKTPDRVFETNTSCPGRTFDVPTVISFATTSNPNGATDFYYFSNIHYNCTDATIAPDWCYTCTANPVNMAASQTNPICAQANGAISLSGTGGLGSNYNYQLVNAAGNVISTISNTTGLVAGNYTGVVSDSMGCYDSQIFALNGGMSAVNSNINSVTCHGDANGAIQLTPVGTTGAVTYTWTVPAGAAAIGNVANPSGLIAGTYNCIVNNGICSDTVAINVTEPAAIMTSGQVIVLNTSSTLPYNGIICSDTITGGTPPYITSWSGMVNGVAYTPTLDTDSTCIIELPNGTYTFYITDANGCHDTMMIQMQGTLPGVQQTLSNISVFKAYPNPASHLLTLEMSLKNADKISIDIVNLAGQKVISRSLVKTTTITEQFDVSNLAKGIYFLQVSSAQGVAAEKIVIE